MLFLSTTSKLNRQPVSSMTRDVSFDPNTRKKNTKKGKKDKIQKQLRQKSK